MSRLLLSCLGLLAFGLAHADRSVTGSYQLRMPEGAQRVARLSGKPASVAQLSLHITGRFTLEVDNSVRHGKYRVEDDHITLDVEDGTTMGGLIRDNRVTIEGLDFERGGDGRRFPTDASSGRVYRIERVDHRAPVELSAPAEAPVFRPVAPPVAVFTPAPVAPIIPPAAKIKRVSALKADDCCGMWTVRRNGLEDKGLRMDLRNDGTFHFSMTGATSEGTWTVEDGNILLVWTKIDGDVVDAGTVKKSIPVADDGSAFQIDTYRYERATVN